MFGRSRASHPNAVNDGRLNHNPHAINDPNGPAPGQRGVVQGFVFTKWLRLHLVDLITMVLMGAVGLGVYYARELLHLMCYGCAG